MARVTDPVEALITGPVATTRPTATLREAATALTADGIGLLVAVDARGVHGVLSERDIVVAIADGADVDDVRVSDHVSEELVTVDRSTPIVDAAATMVAAQVRHLAVTHDDEVVAIVSLRDVVDVLLEDLRATT